MNKWIQKFRASFTKEFLLLIKDWGSLIILFLMPAILLIIVTAIQNTNYEKAGLSPISMAIFNYDTGKIGNKLNENLQSYTQFKTTFVSSIPENQPEAIYKYLTDNKIKFAMIIPSVLSSRIEGEMNSIISPLFGDTSKKNTSHLKQPQNPITISLIYDPEVPQFFKEQSKLIIQNLEKQMEVKFLLTNVVQQLQEYEPSIKMPEIHEFINFKELQPNQAEIKNVENGVQYNVIAWGLFALFFIMSPLSISLVKEKNYGTLYRLKSLPLPYEIFILAKTLLYLIVAWLQFCVMVLAGKLIFPLVGLIPFEISMLNFLGLLAWVTIPALAAVGFGIFIGSFCSTSEQAAPLSALLVVVLSAFGGIWVPEFVMPEFMLPFVHNTPVSWALKLLNGFLNNTNSLILQLTYSVKLVSLFLVWFFISYLIEKKKFY